MGRWQRVALTEGFPARGSPSPTPLRGGEDPVLLPPQLTAERLEHCILC